MKFKFDSELHHKIHKQDKMYGTTTIGTKGQVVIPAEARKDLGLKPGDKLVVMGRFDKVLGLVKAEQLNQLISTIMEQIGDEETKKYFKNEMGKFLGKIRPATKE